MNALKMNAFFILIISLNFYTLALTKDITNLKIECEHHFNKNEFHKAASLLNKIIKIEPDDYQNYFKRATAKIALYRHKQAINDLDVVIKKKPDFKPGHLHLANTLKSICNLEEALKEYKKVIHLSDGEGASEAKEIMNEINSIKYMRKKLNTMNCESISDLKKIYSVCSFDPDIIHKLSNCYENAKDFNQLTKTSSKMIKIDKNDIESYVQLSNAYYYLGRFPVAIKVLKKGLKSDPESKPLIKLYKKIFSTTKKLEEAKSHLSRHKRIKALNLLNEINKEVAAENPFLQEVQQLLCENNGAIKRHKETIKTCTAVLQFDSKNFAALKNRGKALFDTGEFERAQMDFKTAHNLQPHDSEVVSLYRKSEREVKKAEMKDYYKILDISRNADATEIKKAYRKMALKWHPDRWKTEEQKKKAQKEFSDVNEANKVLSDPDLRRRYDMGENVYKDDGRQSHTQFDFGGGFPFNFAQQNGQSFFFYQ